MMAATPMPPAVHTEISARPLPFSLSSLAAVATMRAPVAAKGWPTASELPTTLSFSRSMLPSGASRPSFSLQKVGSSQAFRVHSTWAAKASWIS